MYNEYLLECAEKNCKPYSYTLYTNVIRQKNISFAKLGVEQCEDCEEFKVHLKSEGKKGTAIMMMYTILKILKDHWSCWGICWDAT